MANGNECDPALGEAVRQALSAVGLEDDRDALPPEGITQFDRDRVRGAVEHILWHSGAFQKGEDLGMVDTPGRVAKMYCDEIFTGMDYNNFPKCTTFGNGMAYDEMVACKCSVISMCAHHLIPFHGVAHCAYIPGAKVIGLSKFNRIVDFFSRRPQVQERLTVQISTALRYILETEDIAVTIRAEHMCVKMRGVQDHNSETVTSKMGGRFMSVPELRQEFLALTR